jgi:hypothetical protein
MKTLLSLKRTLVLSFGLSLAFASTLHAIAVPPTGQAYYPKEDSTSDPASDEALERAIRLLAAAGNQINILVEIGPAEPRMFPPPRAYPLTRDITIDHDLELPKTGHPSHADPENILTMVDDGTFGELFSLPLSTVSPYRFAEIQNLAGQVGAALLMWQQMGRELQKRY